MIDNISAYQTIGWIINHSENGFFSLIASASMQSRVAAIYHGPNVAVYDYRLQQEEYSFQRLEAWISAQPDKSAYFLLNFQQALSGEQTLSRLNFSRDMLWSLNKNIVFCMTKSADDLLCRTAYDFYSYIKLSVVFEDEFVETPEQRSFIEVVVIPQREGEYKEQLELEPYEQWSEEKQLAYAISLSNQAEVFQREFRYSDARYLLETALNIKKSIWGDEHPSTGIAYNNIGSVYQAQGEYGKALEYYQKALDTRIKTLGMEHPSTGATYSNIAGVYMALRDYEKAHMYYKKALAILQLKLGLQHPDTVHVQEQIERLRNQAP